jgi:hypothetical protein
VELFGIWSMPAAFRVEYAGRHLEPELIVRDAVSC